MPLADAAPGDPAQGEVWMLDFDPTRGHEQAGRRPALVVSENRLNYGPSGLVIAIPITSKAKGIPFHVAVLPPEGGLTLPSFIKCEDIRSVDKERLLRRLGTVSSTTLNAVEDRLRILLGL